MTEDEVIESLKVGKLKGLTSLFEDDELIQVVRLTEYETGYIVPLAGNDRIHWFLRRATRHALYLLLVMNANKFKYKQINLQQRFEHYLKLIEMEDKAWEASDAPLDTPEDRIAAFGHVASAGFAYDRFGKDITYSEGNRIIINPMKV